MNDNELPIDERRAFDELLTDDRFDDSVSGPHQTDLRSQVLQAFDRPSSEIAVVELHSPNLSERQSSIRRRRLGFAAIVAIGLMGLVAVWFYRGDRSADRAIVQPPPTADWTEDPLLIASLAEVDAFQMEVSRKALFNAIAMCELDHEGRTLFDVGRP